MSAKNRRKTVAPKAKTSQASLELLQQAIALHSRGGLAEAEALYRKVIAVEPGNPVAHSNLGAALRDLGRKDEAANCFRQAIRAKPDFADAISNLALCLADAKDFKGALKQFDAALKIDPKHADAYYGRGTVWGLMEEWDKAETDLRKAIALNPHHHSAHTNLSNSLLSQRRFTDAIAVCRDALKHNPGMAIHHANLGAGLIENNELAEAIEQLEKAIALDPKLSSACSNLGTSLSSLGRHEEAVERHRQAIAADPSNSKLYVNYGAALREVGRLAEAAEACRTAIALDPDYDYAHNNLGNVLREQGQLEEAVVCYRRCITLDTGYLVAHSNLLFTLNSLPGMTGEQLLAEHRAFAKALEPLLPPFVPHTNSPEPGRRVRIGYVSPDFVAHSVSYFVETLLDHHDRRRFHITCYAVNRRTDAVTRRLKEKVDVWRDAAVMSELQLAEQIRADNIDVLIDLAGHTGNNRLFCFAHKPAPVQVTYCGYPNTTGLDSMDYRLVDEVTDPTGIADAWHSETLLRLPETFLCYRPFDSAPPPAPRPARAEGVVTFGSFNALSKMTPQVVALWSSIMTGVANSRLLLKSNAFNDAGTAQLFRDQFAAHGIAAERLTLLGRIPLLTEHLEAYGKVDICLDPFPYNGTTTTCEALWMGVPVVTLKGERHVGRVSASLLLQLGLDELVVDSEAAYRDCAIALAQDLDRLERLGGSLRERMRGAPLMDAARFTRHFETALAEMWSRWCAEQGVDLATVAPYIPPPEADDEVVEALVAEGVRLILANDAMGGEAVLRKALALDPSRVDAHLNLGSVLKQGGRLTEALEHTRKAVELKDDWATAWSNLGATLFDLGRLDDATEACNKALALDPTYRNAYSNLGSIAAGRGNNEEAVGFYRRAIELDPKAAEVFNNLGAALISLGRLQEANECLSKAVALVPQQAEFRANQASVLCMQGRVTEAIAANRQVVAMQPKNVLAWSNLLLTMNYADDLTPQQLSEDHKRWGESLRDLAVGGHANDRDPARRLRIGFVSADLCGHSVAFFFQPLLRNLAVHGFETFCYADVPNPDYFTEQLQEAADHWRWISGLNSETVAARIREDQIDLLVDLGGHTSRNRLQLFARKPAPVQVTWLGYPNTTGLAAMDYRVTDAVADPEGEADALYTETLVRLPNGFLCYEAAPGSPDVQPPPALTNGHITFGSFNKLSKISPTTMTLWSAVLKAVPGSRLVMKSREFADEGTLARCRDLFGGLGIASERIDFVHWQPYLKSHLEIYHRVDIGLDAYPYNGTTTTCEALRMGVPVITLSGDRHAARVGASINTRLGLTELIAASPEAFVAKAAALANDLPRLTELRRTMRERMAASPLCDAGHFAAEMAAALRGMWRDWCLNDHQPGKTAAVDNARCLAELLPRDQGVVVFDAHLTARVEPAPWDQLVRFGKAQVFGFLPGDADCLAAMAAYPAGGCRYFSVLIGDGAPQPLQEKAVETVRLDSLTAVADVDFLRFALDGGELKALMGTTGILDRVVAVEAEVSFVADGRALFAEVDDLLRRRGFQFATFSALHQARPGVPGKLIEGARAVFVKDLTRLADLASSKLLALAIVGGDILGLDDVVSAALTDYDRRSNATTLSSAQGFLARKTQPVRLFP